MLNDFKTFAIWIIGFIILLSLDLFMESVVFEWLKWNGTTKNDWFFLLWWGLVLSWVVFGYSTSKRVIKKLKK